MSMLCKTSIIVALAACFLFSAATQNPKLTNLPENTWMILDSNGIDLSGHFAYSGGAYDRANHKFLVFGGGHNDGWQNNILCFDIATDTWNSMSAPDPQSDYNCGNVNTTTPGMLLNRQRPASRHSYDMIEYMDNIGKIIVWSGPTYSGIWSCPGNTLPADTWLYKWSTNQWEYKNVSRQTQPSGEAMCGTFNIANNLYYAFNNADFFTYNAVTDIWTKLAASTGTKPSGYDHSMVSDRQGQKFYLFDGQMKIYTVSTNAWANTSGAPSATNDNPSYDEYQNDVLCLGDSANKIQVFHTDTKTWEALRANGPLPAMDNICYGRFFYDPVDNVHLYMAQVNYKARTYAYRYKGNSGNAVQVNSRVHAASVTLSANPNPFASGTKIRVSEPAFSLNLYNAQGQLVKSLKTSASILEYAWDGCDNTGKPLPNGLYMARFTGTARTAAASILLAR